MITLYTGNGSNSSHSASSWLKKHNLPHTVRNIQKKPLTDSELRHLLTLTYNGFDDIISKRSKAYELIRHCYRDLDMTDMMSFIRRHPNILRVPIIFDDKGRLLVGYDQEELTVFLPRSYKPIWSSE